MTDTTTMNARVRDILFDRRRELQGEVDRHILDRRTDQSNDVHDAFDRTDADSSEDVEFALIQMKAEMMSRIDEALSRLGEGTSCEERGEPSLAVTRRLARQHTSLSRPPVVVSS